MSGVYKQALKSLQPGTQNALVIGIIVNSFNMKTIDATRTRCMNFIFSFLWIKILYENDKIFYEISIVII